MFNPKKGKTIKRHQKIIYWNSNNTIPWFFILVFVSLRTRRPFGGINALKTEHLFINACYNLAVIPEHFTNQWFSVTISLLLQNGHQIWNLDSMCFVKITKRSDFLKHKLQMFVFPRTRLNWYPIINNLSVQREQYKFVYRNMVTSEELIHGQRTAATFWIFNITFLFYVKT